MVPLPTNGPEFKVWRERAGVSAAALLACLYPERGDQLRASWRLSQWETGQRGKGGPKWDARLSELIATVQALVHTRAEAAGVLHHQVRACNSLSLCAAPKLCEAAGRCVNER